MKKSQLKEFIKSSLMNEENSSSDLFNKLESLLKTHDWFYMMSDDNRKYNIGSSQQQEIRAIVKTLTGMGEGEKAKELYNKYAPYTPGGSDLRMKEAAEKTAFVDGQAVEYKDKSELNKLKDNSDVKSIKTASGERIKEEDEEEGVDTSMDKVAKALSAVQKKLDQMFADFKMGKMNKDEYMSKRKELQAKRDKLNAALISFEEDEDEI